MKKRLFATIATLFVCATFSMAGTAEESFKSPDDKFRPYTLWWLNGRLDKEIISYQMKRIKADGFGGVAPLSFHYRKPETIPYYLSDGWFEMYESIIENAKEQNMQMMFYDDCDFPSGRAGGRMKDMFPDDLMKYLWQGKAPLEYGKAQILAPDGVLEIALAYDTRKNTFEDVTKDVVYADAPQDEWQYSVGSVNNITRPVEKDYLKKTVLWKNEAKDKVLYVYIMARVPKTQTMDWLSADAMKKFMSLTYGKMAERFDGKGVWGDVVKSTFFDDLSFFSPMNCSSWSASVPKKFEEKYGFSPAKFYPYLFNENYFDTPQAGAARSMIFSVRSEIFSDVFPKISQEWCAERKMAAAGHPAETYALEPLQFNGDPILFYRHTDTVLMDSIHRKDYSVRGAKIPTSAAVNYDKDTVYCEIYGNFQPESENDMLMLYRGAIDMFARGCNSLIAHGTWLDSTRVAIIPEISWRNPLYKKELPEYNLWAARVQSVLQGSRNVADLAIYYPIRTLEANYKFAPKRVAPMPPVIDLDYADYYRLGSIITDELKMAFHYLHPEVFASQKVSVKEDGALHLDGKMQWQDYKALILPSCEYMSLAEMNKILAYYEAGGVVIATGVIPRKASTTLERDEDIRAVSDKMFGKGLNGIFIKDVDATALRKAFAEKQISWNYYGAETTLREDIACLHAEKDGRDYYFVGNSSKKHGSVKMRMQGPANWQIWDPHTGEISPAEPAVETILGQDYAVFDISLDEGKSIFLTRPVEKQD